MNAFSSATARNAANVTDGGVGAAVKRPLKARSTMLAHWSDEWLGRPWEKGQFECWDLVYAVRLARGAARSPDAEAWAARARGVGPLRRAALLEAAAAEGRIARPLQHDEIPQEGDGLSMREGGGDRASHAGVLVALSPAAPPEHVLHCLPEAGVVRHRIADLPLARLEADRVWRFLA